MIYSDDLSKLSLFSADAAEFLARAVADPDALALGRHDLNGTDFANVVAYSPKPREAGVYEAHKQFVDIQVALAGAELCEVAPLAGQHVCQPYDEAGDAELYTNEVAGQSYLLAPGRFIVLEPQDAHMPGLTLPASGATSGGAGEGDNEGCAADAGIKKIIFKIKI